MSSNCRATAEKLRRKYARMFDVPIDDVQIREWPGDHADVWAPSRPDLPVWNTGECP